MYLRPVPLLLSVALFCLFLLLLWSVTAKVSRTAVAIDVSVGLDGVVSAEFPADTTMQVGQTVRLERFGQQVDSLIATIDQIRADGRAKLQLNDQQHSLALGSRSLQIEQAVLIIEQQTPMRWLLTNR